MILRADSIIWVVVLLSCRHPEVVISALSENSCELQDPTPDAPSDFLRGQGVMLQLLARRSYGPMEWENIIGVGW